MSLNKTDTRQRAYASIDTSSPAGEWVNEATYNRRGTRGVLIGNWQEEEILREEMKGSRKPEDVLQATKTFANFEQSKKIDVHLTLPKQIAKVYKDHAGRNVQLFVEDEEAPLAGTAKAIANMESSKYLTSTGEPVGETVSVTHATYKAPEKPVARKGARQALMEEELLRRAKEETEAEQQRNSTHSAEELRHSYDSTYKRTISATAAANQLPKTTTTTTTQDTVSFANAPPITFYTERLKEEAFYHTATTSAVTPFARNATFSTPIQEYTRGSTKD